MVVFPSNVLEIERLGIAWKKSLVGTSTGMEDKTIQPTMRAFQCPTSIDHVPISIMQISMHKERNFPASHVWLVWLSGRQCFAQQEGVLWLTVFSVTLWCLTGTRVMITPATNDNKTNSSHLCLFFSYFSLNSARLPRSPFAFCFKALDDEIGISMVSLGGFGMSRFNGRGGWRSSGHGLHMEEWPWCFPHKEFMHFPFWFRHISWIPMTNTWAIHGESHYQASFHGMKEDWWDFSILANPIIIGLLHISLISC